MPKMNVLLVSAIAVVSLTGAGCAKRTVTPAPTPSDDLKPLLQQEQVAEQPVVPSQPAPENTAPVLPTEPTPVAPAPTTTEPAPTPTSQPVATAPAPSTAPAAPSLKTFDVTARQWEFEPSTIRVKQGDNVTLRVTSTDVEHSFALGAYGISEDLKPFKTVTIDFVADKKGTFTFSCTVFCGSGHSKMKGSLIVE